MPKKGQAALREAGPRDHKESQEGAWGSQGGTGQKLSLVPLGWGRQPPEGAEGERKVMAMASGESHQALREAQHFPGRMAQMGRRP